VGESLLVSPVADLDAGLFLFFIISVFIASFTYG
jgi:hypothetical protein